MILDYAQKVTRVVVALMQIIFTLKTGIFKIRDAPLFKVFLQVRKNFCQVKRQENAFNLPSRKGSSTMVLWDTAIFAMLLMNMMQILLINQINAI